MKVNFNNLRRTLIQDYNALVEKALNVDRVPEEAYDEIKGNLRLMRNGIVVLACIHDEDAGIVSLADEKIIEVP